MYEGTPGVWGLRKLGETGFDSSGYQPPALTLDTVVKVSDRATVQRDVHNPQKKRKIQGWGIDPETLPDRVLVLGSVHVYGGGPCKSGTLLRVNVHYVAATGQGNVQQQVLPADTFFFVYELQKKGRQTGTLRELLQ